MQMRHGFSLVELSIVLIILGLLTGGILAGQSLIRASELRSIATDIDKHQAAINTFRDKYFALPGDMTNATKFWTQDPNGCPHNTNQTAKSATCDGNGDGNIANAAYSTPAQANEAFRTPQQLSNAGLIEGSYTGVSGVAGDASSDAIPGTNIARTKIGQVGIMAVYRSVVGITYETPGNYLMVGTEADQAGFNDGPFLKAEEAWNIDTKMDDGKPGQGRLLGYFNHTGCTTSTATTADYALNNTASNLCGIELKL